MSYRSAIGFSRIRVADLTNKILDKTDQTVVSLGPHGRVLIPSALRQSLHLTEGERFVLSVEDNDTLSLHRIRDRISAAEGLFKDFAPEDGQVSDQLIVERRQDATAE
ncbi:MAG: AbrB/MazE/SpoVT family DNA-binding domain-containing protein [Leptolyngbya sp. SIO4C1]|nr:AbrB/MazE/SpoVT family DNA-binding domain-containing protein [Leptolyngbya sp. SIO4C1]